MKYLLFVLLVCFLGSCMTHVHFNEPQPKNSHRLDAFPAELQGSWKRESGETFVITESYMTDERFIQDSLGLVIDTIADTTYLSDSLQLHTAGDYYVYNVLFGPFYVFAVVEKDQDGNWNHYYCDDPHMYKDMRGLKMDSAAITYSEYFPETDELNVVDTTLLKPKKRNVFESPYDEIRSVYFSGQIRIKDLKKLCKEEYFMFSLRKNGTYYERDDEE